MIIGSNESIIKQMYSEIESKFNIQILGFPKYFLGIEIIQTNTNDLFLSQPNYILDMLADFKMSDYLGKDTPMMPIANYKSEENSDGRGFPF